MRINKILSFVALVGGIIILMIGITLQFANVFDQSYIFTKNGGIETGIINGPGAIIIGVSTLFLSASSYFSYKKLKKLHAHQKALEDVPDRYTKKARKNLQRLRNIKSRI